MTKPTGAGGNDVLTGSALMRIPLRGLVRAASDRRGNSRNLRSFLDGMIAGG